MTRSVAFLLAAALWTAGCGESQPPPVTIIDDGCITAAGDQFVLTDLEPAEAHPSLRHASPASRPRPTTEAYLLTGADDRLRTLVGRRVRIVGEADSTEVADIRTISPLVRVGPEEHAVGTAGASPTVGIEEKVRLEVHRLRVSSAEPTGDDCTAMTRHTG
jgi:hypothetical protein